MFGMMKFLNNSGFKISWNVVRSKYCGPRFNNKFNQYFKGPETAQLEIAGSGSPGDPASAYLKVGDQRYLFNCGEGTRRIMLMNRIRTPEIEHIFVTQTNWFHTGGIASVIQDIEMANRFEMTLHGPPRLITLVKDIKRNILALTKMKVKAIDSTKSSCFEDSSVEINYVPLHASSEIIKSGVENQGVEDNHSQPPVMAYICKIKELVPSIDAIKCVDLGIEVGPMLRDLALFKNVTLPDGRFIRATDVYGSGYGEVTFFVLDIPSTDYLKSLRENELFREFYNQNVELILHFSPQDIISSPDYKDFVNKFSIKMNLVVNKTNRYTGFKVAHVQQSKFNQIDKDLFPELCYPVDNSPNSYVSEGMSMTGSDIYTPVSTLSSYWFRGKKSASPPVDEICGQSKFNEERSIDFEQISRDSIYPKIVFLGTGASCPGINTNCAGILLHLSKDSCFLLDCGEGTYGQIVRLYGDRANDIFRKINGVFVSHMHMDHFLGLIELFKIKRQLDSSPLSIFGPDKLKPWIHLYSDKIERIALDFDFYQNKSFVDKGLTEEQARRLGLISLQICNVIHSVDIDAFGISLTAERSHTNNVSEELPFKLTYSGDTIPCDDLVNLGMNSTVLIHEATYADDLKDKADKNRHSTNSEAIEQGRRMNAKYTLLTHFSQRYKIAHIEGKLDDNIGVAVDNVELIESDIPKLSKLYPRLFSEINVKEEQCEKNEAAI